ncbi:hypothetical protein [Virgibacillus sp. Bac330]|nr:hypothetical protein [Virgibacillus sp. Bac330]
MERLGNRVKELSPGTIKTKQFQGKEYHYSIEVSGQVIIVMLE